MIATHQRLVLALIIGLFASGCSSTVIVADPSIPQPHFEKLPLDVAVRIPAEFQNFVHEENVLGREAWKIELGSANASFFEQLFGYMFDSVILLGPDDDALDFTFDALIEPSIEGFEFSVPNQSKSDAFAVWIRYRMQLYDSAGTTAGNWTVSAYGKSQKQGMGGSDSLRRAAILAMRDAAALILLQMEQSTRISRLANGPIDIGENGPPTVAEAAGEVESTRPRPIFAIGGIDDDGE